MNICDLQLQNLIIKELVMRKFFQTKRMMSFVCVLFTAILSLCSINIMNYHDLLTTSSQEEVYTSNENDNNMNSNEENNSQNDNNETNKSGSDITPPQNTDTATDTSEDDFDDVVGARDTWDNHASTSLSGSGKSSDPYKIENAADLAYLARDDADKSAYYELTNNIDLSGYDWMPIQDFQGYFDGNGYTISNMTINTTNLRIGLFGSLDNDGDIDNFILTGSINFSLSGTVSSYNKYFIGGVVGLVEGTPYPYATTISSVASFVDISFSCNAIASSIDGLPYFYIGGIAGATDSDGKVIIDECVFEGDICINQHMASLVDSNRIYCGGILGRAITETYINSCINYGSIRYSNQYSAYYTGGILGYAEVPSTKDEDNVSVYSCINYGPITVNNKSDDFRVGGIVGQMGEKSFWLNNPTGSIEYCINYGNVTTSLYCKYSGQIAGYLDSEFYAVACKYPARMFGERNDSTGMWISMAYSDLDDVKDFMNDYRDSAYSDDNCWLTFTGMEFASNNSITNDYITVGDFIREVDINVAVRNEDGRFTRIPNKKLGYDIGYNTDMKIYKRKISTETEYLSNIQNMFKSTSEYEIISSIYNNSNGKYEYIGLSTSLNEEDIFTDETRYSSNTYDLPYDIYVLFDIAGEEEPIPVPDPEPDPEPEPEPELPIYFRVYYTERIGFNGNLPSDLHLDRYRTGGSVVTEIGGVKQTSNSGYIGYSKVKYQASVAITAIPEAEFELCGIYAGDVGENPYECINLAEFMLNETYKININFPADLSFSQVKYSFNNEIYDDEGYLVTEFSIVFSKYQYSGISFTQTFETDRFDEPYEYEVTTNFIYGYLKRTLNLDGLNVFGDRDNLEPRFYVVDEDGRVISQIAAIDYQLDFRDRDLNFNFFDGDGSHYVGELLTPTYGITNPTSASELGFYWLWGANDTQDENTFYFRRYTGDTQFSNNRTIIEGRGLTAVPANKANNYPPFFTINLYNYFIIGNAVDNQGNMNPTSAYLSGPGFNYIDFRVFNGNSAFKAGSVSFKEYSDPSQQQNFNLYFLNTYEDTGSNDLLFGDNGGKFEVSSLGGFDVQKTSFKVEDGVVYPVDAENGEEVEGYSVLNIGLRFTYQFVFRNSDPFESYYDTEGDDVILNEEDKQLIMETPITELFRFTKSPNYLYYNYFDDRNTLIWDLPTYSSIDLSDFTIYDLALKMLEDDEENATYQNMENGNILLYNYFEVNRFRIVVMLDDEYSFDIDSVLSFYVNDMKYPQSSAEQYAIGNIKAYSEIELEIEDSVIYDSRLGRYAVYAYNNITSGGVQMTNQDSWHFQVIPEINSQNLVFTVNLDEVFSMTSSDFSSSSIQRVGNMWYIDEARDFYYLYYLNAFAGEDFEGIRLIQTANIDFGGDLIMPLGTSSTPFRGVYDGQYYTIQNFEINFGSASNVGFFGYVDGAEIKNLTLLDGTVEGFDNVGGVVGYANNSTLTRLGNYSVNVSGGGSYSINNNIFVITTTGQFTPLSYANLDTYVNKGLSEELLMRNNSGSIDFTTYPTSSQTSMGGFAGFVSLSTLNTCFSRGNVNGSATERGGFVGRANYSSITYCYTTYSTPSGMLSGTTTSHYHTTNGRDIDDVCSTCADRFIW